ncbi:hypothetical protein BDW74DRAFT_178029 [Aspergillus multicolor]|uniref:uncharacterized protein n=1 Tax=Aspergillus multicolor TaxID=41759 RepID=UPI003CCDB172
MAEPLGLGASVTTPAEVVKEFYQFIRKLKSSREDLLRYYMVLETINKTTSLMDTYAKQSEAIQKADTKLVVDGKERNIIEFCADSIESLVDTVRNLTKMLKAYYDPQGGANKATVRMLLRMYSSVKRFFREAPSAMVFVLNQNHINDMIQTAKQIESSLHYAFSTILLARNEIKTDETQLLITNMKDSFTAQFKDLQDLQKSFKAKNPVVIDVKAEQERPQPKAGLRTRIARSVSTSTRASQTEPRVTRDTGVSPESSQSTNILESESSSEKQMGQYPPSSQEQDSDFETGMQGPAPLLQTNQTEAGDYETDDAIFSQSEYFPMTTDDEQPTYSIPVHDTQHLEIGPNADLFIDGGVSLTNCARGSEGEDEDDSYFQFCVKTMIVHDEGPPVLILKEPCGRSKCEHVSVCARGGLSEGLQTPCYLETVLREAEAELSSPDDSNSESASSIHLLIRTHCESSSRSRATLVYCRSGRSKSYAVGTYLIADFPAEAEDGDEDRDPDREAEAGAEAQAEEDDARDSETSSQQSTVLGTVNEENGTGTQTETLVDGSPFTSLPCLFCREDALNPEFSAWGGQAFFIV